MKQNSSIRSAFIWNTLSSATYAAMSFLMLLVTVRLCGLETGGIFSIAFSTTQMLQAVSYFGMRNFQATDINGQFQFSHYLSSRLATSLLMAAVCLTYALFMQFEGEKLVVFLLFSGVKLCEGMADVLEGMMHQHNRLDHAAKALFLRTILIILVYITTLLAGLSLTMASLFSFFAAIIGLFFFTLLPAMKYEKVSFSMDISMTGQLLLQCLPLFLTAASWSYLVNAPKIAIDLYMDDRAQAEFSIIFMPAFLINLLSGFVFRPLLNTMAVVYTAGDKARFSYIINRLILIDIAITLVALTGAWMLGVPILNWVYGVDISHLKDALLVIILGGGGCALVSLLCQTLTVIRQQVRALYGYLFMSILTLIFSGFLVRHGGIMGAVILYVLSMFLLLVILLFIYVNGKSKTFTY